MRPRTAVEIFIGLVIIGFSGFVAYFITDERLFFMNPLAALVGMVWLGGTLDKELMELRRRLGHDT